MERDAGRDSHAMICVSEAMKRYVTTEWSISPDKVRVVPCCTDTEAGERALRGREAMRASLGLGDKFVVTYTGSTATYQKPMGSLAVFRKISHLRPNAHFLGITTQPRRLEEAAEQAGVKKDQRTIVSLPHLEVPAYLAAADVGLLIRESSLVNQVASPVKFAEYLSCGVPLIVSEGIGDYSNMVKAMRLGCVLPHTREYIRQVTPLLSRFLEELHDDESICDRCTHAARTTMAWAKYAEHIEELYGELNTEGATA